jgi:hypothetical protein
MKYAHIALFLCIVPVLFASCDMKPGTTDVNYHTGSDGLVMALTNEKSLGEMYESSSFVYGLTIENKGAYDVAGDGQGILTIGYDPYYIAVNPDAAKQQGQQNPIAFGSSNLIVKGISLQGKSRYYPTGSKAFLYFPYFTARNITGQRSQPETQIFSSICYPYSTTFSSMACIDFDIYHENTRSQICKQQDLSGSSQGAPVAVTQVEVQNLPTGDNLVRPVFTVHVENIGRGYVLSPVDNLAETERVCTNQDISSTSDFNQVGIEAWLSNSIKLECTPDKIRMTQSEGISRCVVKDEDLEKAITYRQSYLSPLTVNLSYVYLSTLKNNIKIKRINPYGDTGAQGQHECDTFQITENGQCVSKCDYCARHTTESMCNPPTARYGIQWNSGFSCRCSSATCDSLYPDGLCVPFSAYCPPASYCCSNECSASQARYAKDGKCYPKCSTDCKAASTTCLCGDEEMQTFAEKGEYCSKDFAVHKDQNLCKEANKELVPGS